MGVGLAVGFGVTVAVAAGVGVAVAVAMGVAVGAGVAVGVGEGFLAGAATTLVENAKYPVEIAAAAQIIAVKLRTFMPLDGEGILEAAIVMGFHAFGKLNRAHLPHFP